MIGIDPGKQGVIAFDNNEFFKMPYLGNELDTKELQNILNKSSSGVVVIEKPFSGLAMSKASILQMGINYGKLLAVLMLNKFRVVEVTPSSWKKKLNLTSNKQESILLCEKLFPKVNLAGKKGKKNDNIAEAFLLIEYGRRTFFNEISN